MKIIQAKLDDLDCLKQIYTYARNFMSAHGNPHQWADNQWPSAEIIRADITAGCSYVCLNESDCILGTFVYMFGKDIEPSYLKICNGDWLDDSPYGVVHRLASSGQEKGVGNFCLDWAYRQSGHLRIDTHTDNVIMQKLLDKLGFRFTGTIYVPQDPYPRLAYEKSACC